MEHYNISRDINNHFSRCPKYITPRGIIFYDRKDYDNYIKDEKIYKEVPISIQSKK
jgi:hypothetical protein